MVNIIDDINPNEWIILEGDKQSEVIANINNIMANLDYFFSAYLKRTQFDPQEVELVIETKFDTDKNGIQVHQIRYYFQPRLIIKSTDGFKLDKETVKEINKLSGFEKRLLQEKVTGEKR